MTDSNKSISPLRQRMIDDMTLRKLSPKTQSGYIRVIQVLLGHKKLDTTARYTQVATKILHKVKGPLESLALSPP